MDRNSEQIEDFSSLLLEHEHYFSNDQPIINFIQKQHSEANKPRISAWNQHSYDQEYQSKKQRHVSPGFQHQKRRIEDFLSTIRIKNGEFNRFQSGIKLKRKGSSFDNKEGQKGEIFLPLNNTVISFPKSRSQSRKLQNEEKIILQKLYRKRQKSNVIPKQILISPSISHTTSKPTYPAKNYLSKNRSFIEEKALVRIQNPENKPIKELNSLRRRFSSSYYKKASGIFQINGKNEKFICINEKLNFKDKKYQTIKKESKKVNSLHDQQEGSSPLQLYKTLYSIPKLTTQNFGYLKDFSIQKIREDAKNSHLNRANVVQKSDIHLLGSTMTKWRNQAQRKVKKSIQDND